MERLTIRYNGEKVPFCPPCIKCATRCDECEHLDKMMYKLADYEDAEEQGLLPKFHLGDEFWTMWLGKPLKAKIVMLQQKKNGIWKYRFCDEQSHTHDYEENEFGKYFWTTKEEAEVMWKKDFDSLFEQMGE